MDFIGDWYSVSQMGSSVAGHPFFICAAPSPVMNNPTGDMDNLYVLGVKPDGVFSAEHIVTDQGTIYIVFTTAQLQEMGVGFIVRWRTATHWGVVGSWRNPSVHLWTIDTPPESAGLPFYRAAAYSWSSVLNIGTYLQGGDAGNNNFSSAADYRAAFNALSTDLQGVNVVLYDAEAEVRYVLIKNASEIITELDDKSKSITTDFITLRSRPQSAQVTNATIRHTVLLKAPPTGTCTTGNVVRPLHVNQGELVNDGDTSTPVPFDITLTRCPRVNIGYSFVAPTGISYYNATGVVDLDSTPGNAQGIGVQISHRNDPVYNNDTIVFNPSDYITNPSYTRNWPQCQSQGTCTNSSTGVNHTIPMQAAVYRTGAVTPGSINASLLFHIVYP